MQERRKFPRKPVSLPVLVGEITSEELKSDILKTKITNLSETGFYIFAPQFKTLSFLKLEIIRPDTGEKIEAKGIVQFNDGQGVGVKVIKPEDEEQRRALELLIFSHIAPPVESCSGNH